MIRFHNKSNLPLLFFDESNVTFDLGPKRLYKKSGASRKRYNNQIDKYWKNVGVRIFRATVKFDGDQARKING